MSALNRAGSKLTSCPDRGCRNSDRRSNIYRLRLSTAHPPPPPPPDIGVAPRMERVMRTRVILEIMERVDLTHELAQMHAPIVRQDYI